MISVQCGSEFVFDPVKWPRLQMDEDFLRISKMFDASRSVVRVPKLDPKFKIAVLASKQVHLVIFFPVLVFYAIDIILNMCLSCCRNTA